MDNKLSKIRIQITNTLNRNKGIGVSSKVEKDHADVKILKELNIIDGIEVNFDNVIKDIILTPILGDSLPVNCYAFALNLYNSTEYRNKIVECYNTYRHQPDFNASSLPTARSEFINYLIKHNYLEGLPNPKTDCLVIYFDDNESPKHAAILESEVDQVVRSKWGTFNAPITHKLWHVPCKTEECSEHDYGTCLKYYHALSQEQAEKYFLEYIQYIQS